MGLGIKVRSSRRVEAECKWSVEVMWRLGRLAPDHKTIAEFRRSQGEPLRAAASRKTVPSIGALERRVGAYLTTLETCSATMILTGQDS